MSDLTLAFLNFALAFVNAMFIKKENKIYLMNLFAAMFCLFSGVLYLLCWILE